MVAAIVCAVWSLAVFLVGFWLGWILSLSDRNT